MPLAAPFPPPPPQTRRRSPLQSSVSPTGARTSRQPTLSLGHRSITSAIAEATQAKAPTHVPSAHGWTALTLACILNDAPSVQRLLEAPEPATHFVDGRGRCTVVPYAAASCHCPAHFGWRLAGGGKGGVCASSNGRRSAVKRRRRC